MLANQLGENAEEKVVLAFRVRILYNAYIDK